MTLAQKFGKFHKFILQGYLNYEAFLLFFMVSNLFVFQVFIGKHFPILIFLMVLFFFFRKRKKLKNAILLGGSKRIKIILLYVTLFVGHTVLDYLSEVLEFKEMLRLGFLFLFPISFYLIGIIYRFEKNEFEKVVFALFLTAIIGSIYMIYDNYYKFILELIPAYSRFASDYVKETNRIFLNDPLYEDIAGRKITNNRSFGLLESAAVSSSVIGIGFLAYLSNKLIIEWKAILYTLFFIFLLIGTMSFTSIFAFILTFLIIIFSLILTGKRVQTKYQEIYRVILPFLIVFSGVTFIFLVFTRPDQRSFLLKQFKYPVEILINRDRFQKNHYFTMIYNEVDEYVDRIQINPGLFLIGDGFSEKTGKPKGADLGFVESIYRFGFPIIGLLSYFFIKMFQRVVFEIKNFNYSHQAYVVQFSFSIILFITLRELHYSVYVSKSILPILFFCLGLFPRSKRETLNRGSAVGS